MSLTDREIHIIMSLVIGSVLIFFFWAMFAPPLSDFRWYRKMRGGKWYKVWIHKSHYGLQGWTQTERTDFIEFEDWTNINQ